MPRRVHDGIKKRCDCPAGSGRSACTRGISLFTMPACSIGTPSTRSRARDTRWGVTSPYCPFH
jgi:hypothetical protein